MRTYLAMLLLGIVALFIMACGGAATAVPPTNTAAPEPTAAPTEAPTATTAPQATEAPAATEEPEQMEGDYSPELLAIAAERANGPGAIFVGDLNDLVGPGSHA